MLESKQEVTEVASLVKTGELSTKSIQDFKQTLADTS